MLLMNPGGGGRKHAIRLQDYMTYHFVLRREEGRRVLRCRGFDEDVGDEDDKVRRIRFEVLQLRFVARRSRGAPIVLWPGPINLPRRLREEIRAYYTPLNSLVRRAKKTVSN